MNRVQKFMFYYKGNFTFGWLVIRWKNFFLSNIIVNCSVSFKKESPESNILNLI